MDHSTSKSLQIVREWAEVASQMQQLHTEMDRYAMSIAGAVHDVHPKTQIDQNMETVARQLKDVGQAMKQFTEDMGIQLEPDIEAMLKRPAGEPSAESAAASFVKGKSNAIKSLGSKLLEISKELDSLGISLQTSASDKQQSSSDTQTAESGSSQAPLSPGAQAIADGFAKILGGKTDPRMGYGRIPRPGRR